MTRQRPDESCYDNASSYLTCHEDPAQVKPIPKLQRDKTTSGVSWRLLALVLLWSISVGTPIGCDSTLSPTPQEGLPSDGITQQEPSTQREQQREPFGEPTPSDEPTSADASPQPEPSQPEPSQPEPSQPEPIQPEPSAEPVGERGSLLEPPLRTEPVQDLSREPGPDDAGGPLEPNTEPIPEKKAERGPNRAPVWGALPQQTLDEEKPWSLQLQVSDPDGDPVRIFVEGLPPGMHWQPGQGLLRWRPDFTQGGKRWQIKLTATDGTGASLALLDVIVKDTIQPPPPKVKSSKTTSTGTLYVLEQKTDAFLDSPGYAGRTFKAHLSVPSKASSTNKLPLNVSLHGFSGSPGQRASANEFFLMPHDSDNTYWWGYSDQLPKGTPTKGTVLNYTQRRVLHLIDWVRQNHDVDPDRVYVSGGSMGGAGAKTLGLLYARHFCYVEATIGQAIPRNHRPSRLRQLETLWGARSAKLAGPTSPYVWDEMDLTRVLREHPEAQEQFIFTYHGKDDPVIHFGAVVLPSPLTMISFYGVLQAERIGHYSVWDEGGHGGGGPVMGSVWSDWSWHRVLHQTTYLRRGLAFPAFSKSSIDHDPGQGKGNGTRTWNSNSGYAADVKKAGDTGWEGDFAGAINRFLRWQSGQIVDTQTRFSIPLQVLNGQGKVAPKTGYPSIGNLFDRTLPVIVDVTLRRVQRFQVLPNETLNWQMGNQSGQITVDTKGRITIPKLSLNHTWQTLTITR